MPSYPPSRASLIGLREVGGLPSSLSGSVPAIFEPYAADHDWGTQLFKLPGTLLFEK